MPLTHERVPVVRQLAEDLCNTYVFNMEPEQYDELWSKKGKAAGGQQTLLPPTQITLRLFDDRTGDVTGFQKPRATVLVDVDGDGFLRAFFDAVGV